MCAQDLLRVILLDRGYDLAANRLQLAAILENAFPFPESNGAVANCPPPLPKTNKTRAHSYCRP